MRTARIALLMLAALFPLACAGGQRAGGGIAEPPGSGGVRGILTHEGRPVEKAYVYAYRRRGPNLLGPADFTSGPSAADGSYAVELVGGSYWVVARKRMSGESSGPLAMGDFYSLNPSNPVAVEEGAWTALDLELEQLRDPMFFRSRERQEQSQGVRGRLVDGAGRPVAWAFAMAYASRDMKRVPEYTSLMTGEDGAFVIHLPRGGRYWIAARKNIREKPVSGEPFGTYEGSEDHSLQVPEGEFVEGVVIRLGEYRKGMLD